MAHLMISSDDQCENKAKMNAKAHSRQQMKFRWSVWTLDGRCGHPSANQNVALFGGFSMLRRGGGGVGGVERRAEKKGKAGSGRGRAGEDKREEESKCVVELMLCGRDGLRQTGGGNRQKAEHEGTTRRCGKEVIDKMEEMGV